MDKSIKTVDDAVVIRQAVEIAQKQAKVIKEEALPVIRQMAERLSVLAEEMKDQTEGLRESMGSFKLDVSDQSTNTTNTTNTNQ